MNFIPESPIMSPADENTKIEAVTAYSNGFIIACNDGNQSKFFAYSRNEDPRIAYSPVSKDPLEVKMESNQSNLHFLISSMSLS